MDISRRSLIAGAAGAAGLGAAALAGAAPASAEPIPEGLNPRGLAGLFPDRRYSLKVPELYAPVPEVPQHSKVVIIGSGFGASVSALRLTQAGEQVTMLERGSLWPNDPWRQTFANDALPDGRGYWFRKSFTGITGIPVFFDSFGGVLDVTDYQNIQVWRGAAVGGGSVVFTGALLQPEQRFFEAVFGGTVSYAEMNAKYYPLARKMLAASPMPDDVYNSAPFGHSRVWDAQARKAGYTPQRIDSIFNWNVVRQELAGGSRKSAIVGDSNLGNSNGAKYDLNQNYLAQAKSTGKLSIHSRHVVHSVGQQPDGRYWIDVEIIEPGGRTVKSKRVTCDRLFLGAGSIGTSELLVKARATGALAHLNDHVGEGWGSNGSAALVRTFSGSEGLTQASPSASRVLDESGLPVTLENWYVPGLPLNIGLIGSLGLVLDSQRASFRYDSASGKVILDWPAGGNDEAVKAMRAVHNKIAAANYVPVGFPPLAQDVNASFTGHPLGGAVLGKVSDSYGRVSGHKGLYVMDGAGMPGSAGTVNPSLTITALAERAIENIISEGI
ncbi:hypothetical protein LFT48_04185 [Arthrobacter sp. FW305-123]|nr:hypothetical protein LFT48_04185 [Arthrobacter sp. FW305-123]